MNGRRIVHRAGRRGGEVHAARGAVHVRRAVDDHAAGAEQLCVHLVHVVAAEHRVARDQRDRGRALRRGCRAGARCSRRACRGRSAGAASRCGRGASSGRCRACTAAGRESRRRRRSATIQSRGVYSGSIGMPERLTTGWLVADLRGVLGRPARPRRRVDAADCLTGLFMSCLLRLPRARRARSPPPRG